MPASPDTPGGRHRAGLHRVSDESGHAGLGVAGTPSLDAVLFNNGVEGVDFHPIDGHRVDVRGEKQGIDGLGAADFRDHAPARSLSDADGIEAHGRELFLEVGCEARFSSDFLGEVCSAHRVYGRDGNVVAEILEALGKCHLSTIAPALQKGRAGTSGRNQVDCRRGSREPRTRALRAIARSRDRLRSPGSAIGIGNWATPRIRRMISAPA